jgi:hypothetical protein
MPMLEGEGTWLQFSDNYPCAIKIGVGRINALNGKRWTDGLDSSECDYITAPPQPALDGFRTQDDVVCQFAVRRTGADPQEEQTHAVGIGTFRIIVYPMKKERYERLQTGDAWTNGDTLRSCNMVPSRSEPKSLSLAAGGRLWERLYSDPFGIDAWDQAAATRCLVSLVEVRSLNDASGFAVGHLPPPINPADYQEPDAPWF